MTVANIFPLCASPLCFQAAVKTWQLAPAFQRPSRAGLQNPVTGRHLGLSNIINSEATILPANVETHVVGNMSQRIAAWCRSTVEVSARGQHLAMQQQQAPAAPAGPPPAQQPQPLTAAAVKPFVTALQRARGAPEGLVKAPPLPPGVHPAWHAGVVQRLQQAVDTGLGPDLRDCMLHLEEYRGSWWRMLILQHRIMRHLQAAHPVQEAAQPDGGGAHHRPPAVHNILNSVHLLLREVSRQRVNRELGIAPGRQPALARKLYAMLLSANPKLPPSFPWPLWLWAQEQRQVHHDVLSRLWLDGEGRCTSAKQWQAWRKGTDMAHQDNGHNNRPPDF